VTARGFSLLECLLGTVLLLVLTTAALEFHVSAQKRFFRLKQIDADTQAITAALNSIRIDLAKTGQGLHRASALGVVEPIVHENGVLTIHFAEKLFRPAADLQAGQTRLSLIPKPAFAAGRSVGIVSESAGEIRTVSSVEGGDIVLSDPLEEAYPAETADIVLIERLSFYMDKDGRTLRRRVNAAAAQPLMEDTGVFRAGHDPDANLLRIEIAGLSNPEKSHVLILFPKNTASNRRSGL
jgi:type II secretory pathway pseudopilin PulG